MIKKLEENYRKNRITPEELKILRQQVNGMSDDKLSERLEESWLSDDVDESKVSDDRMLRIKRRIDNRTFDKHDHTRTLALKYIRIAAAIMLPVLLFTTVFLYRENRQMVADVITFTTGKGEKATVILPDNTTAMLNYDSRLIYTPGDFNKNERRIEFEGEAYFEVTKKDNGKCPFYINMKNLEVKVLGTKFNLSARKSRSAGVLALDEGRVRLTSSLTHKSIILNSGQSATVDYATGNITVSKNTDTSDARAWQNGYVVFKEEPINNVLEQLEQIYDVNIRTNGKIAGSFTGTLPMNNLHNALLIVSKSFHATYTIKGNNIKMAAK